AGQDHDAVTVGEIVEAVVLEFALTANGVEPKVEDVTELGLHALALIAQEHVRRPARAANEHVLTVDDELAITLLGEVRADGAYAERRAGLPRDGTINGSSHLQTIERMRTHADRPPDLRMPEVKVRVALGGERYDLRLPGGEVNRSSQRNAGHDAGDRCVVCRRIEVARLHLHGERGAREIGKRERRA